MGGGQSSPGRAPPIIREEPYPSEAGIDGISFASAKDCTRCEMTIAKGISTSSVKLLREFGKVTQEECSRLARDIQRVRNNQMAFREFKSNLQAGRYLRQL